MRPQSGVFGLGKPLVLVLLIDRGTVDCAVSCTSFPEITAALALVVKRWENLPPSAQQSIVSMVDALTRGTVAHK